MGGQGITGTTDDTVYVPYFNIQSATTDNMLTEVLVIDTNGDVKKRSVNTIGFTGGTVSGATIFTGGLSANTFSATTYYNLPLDIFTTGGTYNNSTGIATFTNNSGGTFNVSGFFTGSTDNFTTGYTYSSNTFTIRRNNGLPDLSATINTMTGLTINGNINITGQTTSGSVSATTITADTITANNYQNLPFTDNQTLEIFLSGGTEYARLKDTISAPSGGTRVFQGNVVVNGGFTATTISATTYYNLPVTADTFTTGFTFNVSNYDLTIKQNNGQTDLTVNLGILASDITITGGTYNPTTGIATFTNNTGGTFSVSGFITGMTDTYVSGFTYSNNNLTIKQTAGQPDLTVNISTMTGLTINGDLVVTGQTTTNSLSASTITATTITADNYENLPFTDNQTVEIFISGGTEYLRVKDTVSAPSGGTRTFQGNVVISSGFTANTISAATYYNLPLDVFTTGGTYNNTTGIATFTNNSGGTFNVSGFFTGSTDNFTTGYTYNNNTFTIRRNNGLSDLTATINTMTGLTINGDLVVSGGTQSWFSGNSSLDLVRITQTGSGNALVVEDADNPDISQFVVDNTGNVGIGTNTPISKLQISNTATTVSTALYTSDFITLTAEATAPGLNIISAGDGVGNRGVFKSTRSRGTLSSPTLPQSGDFTFSLLGAAYDGVTNFATAGISYIIDGTVTGNTIPQRIVFETATGNTRTERMRITSDGKVGIGITPSAALSVRATAVPSAGENIATFQVSDASGVLGIQNFTNSDGVFVPSIVGNQASGITQTALNFTSYIFPTDDTGTNPAMTFRTGLNTFTGIGTRPLYDFRNWNTSLFLIAANGNVGIGTISPSAKLHVSGGTLVNGDFTATTVSATTYYNLPVTADTFTTGFTYSNNIFTIRRNNGLSDLTATINTMTGLTINGNLTVTGQTTTNSLSASTLTATTITATDYQNLPFTDNQTIEGYVSGSSTYIRVKEIVAAPSGGTRTFQGNVVISSGFTANTISATTYYNLPLDIYTTGGTFNNITGVLSLTNNSGGTFNVSGFTTTTPTLSQVLSSGNTTSGYDIIISSGDTISNSGGTSSMYFGYGIEPNEVNLQSGVSTLKAVVTTQELNGVSFYHTHTGTTSTSSVTVHETNGIGLSAFDNTFTDQYTNIFQTGDAIIVEGDSTIGSGSTFSGIEYLVDYSSNYSNRSLVDKEYVGDLVGAYLPLSGGTVSGGTRFTAGLSANTLNVTGLTQTSGITSTGGITFKQITINSSYTATTSDYMIDVTGGTFTVSLPSAIGIQGRMLVIKNNGGGAVTVDPYGSETIDDKLFIILGETNSIQLASNGVGWVAMGYNISTVNSSTGVFEFTGLTKLSDTTFSVAEVKGWIVDDTTNPLSPQLYYVYYSGGSHTALYVNTASETWVYLTSGGTVAQQSTPLTATQRRVNITLGKLGHANKTSIINAFSQPDYVLSPLAQLRDMFLPINIINGGVYPSTNGANLKFNTSAGYIYGLGINFASDTLNPNSLYVSGNTPTTFQYRTQTGGTATNTTDIDPTKYDVGGVVTPITGTKATNQRIYLVQNGGIRVMYGQTTYNNFSDAVQGLQTETFTPFSNFVNNGVLIGILTVLSTATDLTDTSKAKFFFASKFGETVGAAGGISTTTLQQAYNNSTNPEITTNSTLNAVQFRGGTGNDADANIIMENNAGVQTGKWLANGGLSATTISATTISATTYQNLPLDVFTTGGTYNSGTGVATFTNNSGGTFTVSGFTTGGTYQTLEEVLVNGNSTGDNWIEIGISGGTNGIRNYGIINDTKNSIEFSELQLRLSSLSGTTGFPDSEAYIDIFNSGNIAISTSKDLSINSDTFNIIGQTPSFSGVQYSSDYSTNFTNRSLVDKEYVDNLVVGGGSFTGGTVSGATNFTGGLTANTISATTYNNLPKVGFSPINVGVCDTAPTAASTQYYYQTIGEVTTTLSKVKLWGFSGSDLVIFGIYRGSLGGSMTLIGQARGTCSIGPNELTLSAETGQNLRITAGEDLVVGYYPDGTSWRTVYDVGISDILFGILNTGNITTMPATPTGTATGIRFACTLY